MAGFIRGILWGGVVAAGGLVVISQVAPPGRLQAPEVPTAEVANVPDAPVQPAAPTGDIATSGDAQPASEATANSPDQSAVVEQPTVSVSAPDIVAEAPAGQQSLPADPPPQTQLAEDASAPVAARGNDLSAPSAADDSVTAPPLPAEAPEQPPSDAPESSLSEADTPAAVVPPEAVGSVPASAAEAPVAIQPSAPSAPDGEPAPDAAELPPPPPLTPAEEALLQPAPEEAPPAVTRIVPGEPAPSAPAPRPGLSNTAEGVITGRLPRIGDTPTSDANVEAAPGEAEGAGTEAVLSPADDASLPPLLRYARPFENPDQKPLFALLLEDNGAEVDRAALAAMAIPLTVVIDPLAEGAAERAAIWRAAGQEVVLSAASLPQGATPGDLEQIFQALAERMPEAVAAIDATGAEFQNNRALAGQIVPILAEQGRGLVTFDQGLNAADQVARREGLAAATVFRRFDLDNASGPVVKRYLDRAVFRAAQEGQVAVIGELTPEIVAGLLEWTVEGRASTVALAPITALLSR